MLNNRRVGLGLIGGGAITILMLSPLQLAIAEETMAADEATQLRFEIQQLKLLNESQGNTIRKMEYRLHQLESGQPIQQKRQAAAPAEPRQKEASPSSSIENILQEEHTLFTDKFTFELGLSYSHYDRKDLILEGFLALNAIFLGDIQVDDIKAEILTMDLTGRYSVNDRWQVGVNVPLVYRNTRFQQRAGSGVQANVDAANIGDVSLTSAFQLHQETEELPDIVWNLTIQAPTGTDPYGVRSITKTNVDGEDLQYPATLPTGSGIWSISNGLSFVKTTDPAIIFANIGYTYNIEQSFDDIGSSSGNQPGKIKLGDSIYYGVGMAFALNERMSLSTSFAQRFSLESEIKNDGESWQEVVGSDGNSATFNTSFTYAITDKQSMTASLGIGLTPDAPDLSVGLKFPYHF